MTGERWRGAEARAMEAGVAAFGSEWRPTLRAVAPGRIELLGNHLDYNGGPVLAAAIDRAMVVLGDEGGDPGVVVAVAADVDPNPVRFAVDALTDWRNLDPPPEPMDYLRGVIAAAAAPPGGVVHRGPRLAFAGDVPIGFGVSSSAALCVGLTLALATRQRGFTETVLLAQEAEHRAGSPCGTLDQSASLAGGVIRFDGADLSVERLDPDLGGLVFAVAASGVTHKLGGSSYPIRVQETKQALDLARAAIGVPLPHLSALTANQLSALSSGDHPALASPLAERVRHVVSETKRVRAGLAALRAGDWSAFGHLMIESGRSSATDYAISHPRVEELVAEVLAVDGVLGARMMGGGEGGTALMLLDRAAVPRLIDALGRGYYARHGMGAPDDQVQVCAFAPGARVDRLG